MPPLPAQPIATPPQSNFHRTDNQWLGHASAIHHSFGRLLDEALYKQESWGGNSHFTCKIPRMMIE